MSECRLTPAAQRDLSSIWDFTEERWDTRQAEKYIRELQGAIERIAADPRRGRARDEIRTGYRSYAIGSHVVFYVPGADHVDVIRILHERMDGFRRM
ncbi:type II toxin-antitoxin system RelE/ParE family toxin [Arthrobacter sp. TMN-50]